MEVEAEEVEMISADEYDDSESYSSDAPPTEVEYRALIRFPDNKYFINDPPKVTLGRGDGTQLYRLSPSLHERYPDSDTSQTGHKRKRSILDIDGPEKHEDYFPGGMCGPSSQEAFQDDDSIAADGMRINIYTGGDGEGNLIDNQRSISKKHVQIYWENAWLAHSMGRNGMWVNDSFVHPGETVILTHGDRFWLKGAEFIFYEWDPDQERRDLDSEDESEDMEEADDMGLNLKDEEESDDEEESLVDDEIDEAVEDGDDEDASLPLARIKHQAPAKKILIRLKNSRKPLHKSNKRSTQPSIEEPCEVVSTPKKRNTKSSKKGPTSNRKPKYAKAKKASESTRPESVQSEEGQSDDAAGEGQNTNDGQPKKRGPGRPPADGVMSKKKRKDEERAKKLGLSSVDELPPPKVSTKPRKDKETGTESADGQKKKKSKRTGGESGDDSSGSTEKKKKKRTPEPAKPPPNREDFTEEQLQKPEETYAQLLYKILLEKDEPMTLPQIYETFEEKWPYYRFQDSLGWQSSIRHNLQSTPCIDKAGKEGKGHRWTLNKDIPFESKTTKKVSQPRPMQYQNQQVMNGGLPQMSGIAGQQQAYAGQQNYYYPPRPNGVPGYGQQYPGQPHQPPRPGGQYQGPPNQPGFNGPGGPNPGPHPTHAGIAPPGVYPNARPDIQAAANQPQGAGPRPGPPAQQRYTAPNKQMVHGQSRPGVDAPSNTQGIIGPAEIAARRLKVFESFRNSFVRTSGNEETRKRYDTLARDATNWLVNHPNSIGYTGTPGEISTVVYQMQAAWATHPSNPLRQMAQPRTATVDVPAANTVAAQSQAVAAAAGTALNQVQTQNVNQRQTGSAQGQSNQQVQGTTGSQNASEQKGGQSNAHAQTTQTGVPNQQRPPQPGPQATVQQPSHQQYLQQQPQPYRPHPGQTAQHHPIPLQTASSQQPPTPSQVAVQVGQKVGTQPPVTSSTTPPSGDLSSATVPETKPTPAASTVTIPPANASATQMTSDAGKAT